MGINVVVLCTVQSGLDIVAELLRKGQKVTAIIGVHPDFADQINMSGWIDVSIFARKWKIPYLFVTRYDLKSENDQESILRLNPDVVLVTGWQRLVPEWLILNTKLGVLGGHGSPDGIHGGRGRSPQNWALILGCKRFDLSLFRITPGIDDGPIISEKSFYYNQTDDISISYKKTALCMAEMIIGVLENPQNIHSGKPQAEMNACYFPQRRPEDGFIDWNISANDIWNLCRSLSKPYPGCRSTIAPDLDIIIWDCVPFDDVLEDDPGIISFVFEDGTFLVNCGDGRVLVRTYEFSNITVEIHSGHRFNSKSEQESLKTIVNRHDAKFPNYEVSRRILNRINK